MSINVSKPFEKKLEKDRNIFSKKISEISDLQNEINKILKENYNSENEKNHIFNFKIEETYINQPIIDNYYSFLSFCREKMNDFINGSDKKIIKMLYKQTDLNNDDNKKISESEEKYKRYGSKEPLTFSQIYFENKKQSDKIAKPFFFDTQKPDSIFKKIEERIRELKKCAENKSKIDHNYYEKEYERENKLITDGVTNLDGIANLDVISQKLGIIADTIQWNARMYNSLKTIDENKIKNLYEYWISGENEEIKKKKAKRLLTFLPINLFNVNYELDYDKFKIFLMNQKDLCNNIQQIVLGYDIDIKDDFSSKFTNPYNDSLFFNYSMIMDIKKESHCDLCDYSIYLNLFLIYIGGFSESKVFPIILKLPQNEYGYDERSNSYAFKTSKPYDCKKLFDAKRKFIGMHLIKYYDKKNENIKILPIFIFNNLEYNETNSSYMYSIHTGIEFDCIHTDYSLSRIEKGEIFGRLSITHQELYQIVKYQKLKTYIMDNDTKELYFTRRSRNDAELQNLVSMLNLKPVKIVKHKIEDVSKISRFKIEFYDKEPTNNNESFNNTLVKPKYKSSRSYPAQSTRSYPAQSTRSNNPNWRLRTQIIKGGSKLKKNKKTKKLIHKNNKTRKQKN